MKTFITPIPVKRRNLADIKNNPGVRGGVSWERTLLSLEWIVDIFTRYMIKPQLANSYTREEDNFFADIS